MNTESLMDRISAALVNMQAARWVPVLHQWLAQYRGLHEAISADSNTPEDQILSMLEQLKYPLDDDDLAQRLSRLDFLTWRARLDQTPWKPLEQPFHVFWTNGVVIWQSDKEYPLPQETKAWLLNRLRQISMPV